MTLHQSLELTLKRFLDRNPQAEPADIIGTMLQLAAEFAVAVADVQPGDPGLEALVESSQIQIANQLQEAAKHAALVH